MRSCSRASSPPLQPASASLRVPSLNRVSRAASFPASGLRPAPVQVSYFDSQGPATWGRLTGGPTLVGSSNKEDDLWASLTASWHLGGGTPKTRSPLRGPTWAVTVSSSSYAADEQRPRRPPPGALVLPKLLGNSLGTGVYFHIDPAYAEEAGCRFPDRFRRKRAAVPPRRTKRALKGPSGARYFGRATTGPGFTKTSQRGASPGVFVKKSRSPASNPEPVRSRKRLHQP